VNSPVTVHLVHPGNLLSSDPDGIVSVQRNFIRTAPDHFDFTYWGVGRPNAPDTKDGPRRYEFRPVTNSGTQRPIIPLSLKFVSRMMLSRRRIIEGVLRFDRIESALPFTHAPLPKVLFLHTWNSVDIRNESSESTWRRAAPIYEVLFDRVVRRADRIYVLRPDMADDLARRLPDSDARIRPFGVPVDASRFAPLAPEPRAAVRAGILTRFHIGWDARLVLFAGRLEGQKRPLALPAIAAALASDNPEVHVLVAGSGSRETALADASNRDAPGRVHLLGSIPQDDLARLLGAVDALVLPSAFEGLPNVVLEALACGTPVVAARHGGRTMDVLAHERAGIEAGSQPADMATALRAVFGWNGQGARERRRIAEGFAPAALNGPIYQDMEDLARRAPREISGRAPGRRATEAERAMVGALRMDSR
jgi:glycosyltransferase involved in cell wall biosynthesis